MNKVYTFNKENRAIHFPRIFMSLFILIFLLANSHDIRAQKAIDSLNFATDGSINTSLINGNFLYFGGYFNYIGQRTGSIAFFNSGSSTPDKNKPLFGDVHDLMGSENVFCAFYDGNGGWYVGGSFIKVDNQAHKIFAHVLSDNTLDPNLNLNWKSSGRISVIKGDNNYLYVGGEFVAKDELQAEHKNVFRLLLPSLKIDPDWNPAIINSTKVEQIEIGGGHVFLSGWIGTVEGIQQDAMVVLDTVSGARVPFPSTSDVSAMHLMGDTLLVAQADMYWTAYPNGFGYIANGAVLVTETNDIPTGASVKGTFYASISDGNGGWYVAGNYPAYGGNGVFHLDKDLIPITTFSQTQVKIFDSKSCLLLNGNSLYVGSNQGDGNTIDDGNGNPIKYLFKLDATTGALDVNFAPNPDGKVRSMVINGDILYIAGDFANIGSVARSVLASLTAATGALQSWNPEIHRTNYNSGYTGGDLYMNDVKLVNDTLYVAGAFQISTVNLSANQRGIYGLSRFDLNTGDVDTSFHISTSYYDKAVVSGIAYKNSKLFVVGNFNLNSAAPVKNVGVLNLKTRELKSLNADFDFSLSGSSAQQKITDYNGNLYILGVDAKQISTGATLAYIASFNDQNYALNSWNPAPNSVVYTLSFNPQSILMSGTFYFLKQYRNNLVGINIKTKEYVQFPDISTINGIVSTDKYIFMGGDFIRYNDSVVNGLFRLNRKDLSFTPYKHHIMNSNKAAAMGNLALGTEGLYVVGVYYNMFNLVSDVGRQNICLLDLETGNLKGWNPPPNDGKIYRVFVSGSDIALTGGFGLMPAWTRYSLARINLTTGKIDDWDPVLTGSYPQVYSMSFSGDTLFIGGSGITKINAVNAGNLCALNPASGSVYAGFVPPALNGNVLSFSNQGDYLFAVGSFTTANAVAHKYVAKFNARSGAVETWDPQVKSWNVKSILATDTAVYIGGFGMQITGDDKTGGLLKVNPNTGTLMKVYPSVGIYSLTLNDQGLLAAGAYLKNGLLLLDKIKDTLVTANIQQEFNAGVNTVKSIGNLFLAAGNGLKEFGKYTTKPGFLVFDPTRDTVITSFSVPVLEGTISSFAANNNTLAMVGNFAGMNSMKKNTDLAFMTMPDLHLEPGVTSWSPQTASNKDPFAVSVFGSGFSETSEVSLISGIDTQSPDSISITDQKIIAFFDGSKFSVGDWDLKVVIDANSSQRFSKAIAIEDGQYNDVWAKWIGPSRVLVGKPISNYIAFGNNGNRDAYGVILYVAVGDKQSVIFPYNITHPQVKFDVNWDTISNYVNVDYFLGEPFHGKVYTLFIPYLPKNYEDAMKIKITSEESHEIRIAISKPIYSSYQALFENLKSSNGMAYDFFSCMYSVAGLVADVTPGLGCAKAAFDNTVLMAVDKYMNNETIEAEDIANSIGLTAIGCVPGEAQLSAAFKIAKGMASMYGGASDAGGALASCGSFASDCFKQFSDIMAYSSHDPNAKYGPSGRGTSHFVTSNQEYHYMVSFENDSSATAPAQRVIITDTLDKSVFNINSFKAIGFGFSDTTYFYNKTDGDTVLIDLRPQKQAIVRVFYHLETSSGILTWTFQTLDPNTFELVEDVDAGFLPPNKIAPQGEGNVLYSIAPLGSLPDSTEIRNAAFIVFDWNKSIPTNSWDNRTDNTGPESNVKPLASVMLNKDFQVHWKGNDHGSGIYSYTVYVAENDDAYYPWLPDTHDTLAVFSGTAGNTYKFYTVATDSAGNIEVAPTIYDAITRVSGTGIETFGIGNQMELMIYPNPSKGIVNVSYYLPEPGRVRIDILNLCGGLVMTPYEKVKASGKNNVQFDLSNVPAGYYFVRILTPFGVQSRKVVIQ